MDRPNGSQPVLHPDLNENQVIKRNRMLRSLHRRGRVSRFELAKRLRISNSRVCELADQMVAEGLLVEHVSRKERRGRGGIPIELCGGFGHLIGFDMEATRLRLAAVDFAGNLVWQTSEPFDPPADRQGLIERILSFIDQGVAVVRERFANLLGIGLAASGVLDVRRGMILHYDLVEAARDIALRDLVAERTGVACTMEDNIRALTLAEWNRGAAQHLHSFACVAVRSGVGAGLVINGELFGGSHGYAGEVGYMGVAMGGSSSRWKHLHHVVSERALGVDTEASEAQLPEKQARQAGELLGLQLASLAALVDPQAIVLAGGLLRPEGPLWLHLTRMFDRMILPELRERVQLLPSQLGAHGAALGAADRCFQSFAPVNGEAC